jgi:hypothetical protein
LIAPSVVSASLPGLSALYPEQLNSASHVKTMAAGSVVRIRRLLSPSWWHEAAFRAIPAPAPQAGYAAGA